MTISSKDRVENNSIKKVNPIEKIQPVPSLLSKVIPQAKINLVQPSVRNQNRLGGSNHSKSVEPKQNVVPKEKPLNERNNKQNPLKTIYDKINIKKEDFGILIL